MAAVGKRGRFISDVHTWPIPDRQVSALKMRKPTFKTIVYHRSV